MWTIHGRGCGPPLFSRLPSEPGADSAPGSIVSADHTGIVIACGSGTLRVRELQLEGGKRLEAGAFLAGHPLAAGFQLL